MFASASGGSPMKKYLVAAALLVAFATPAFADAVYVMLNQANHKCITTKSPGRMHGYKMMGKYPTLGEAQTAMHTMTVCQ
jgi:hypothetical protein